MKKLLVLLAVLFLCRPTFAAMETEAASDWVTAVFSSVNESFAKKVVKTTYSVSPTFGIEPTFMLGLIATESNFSKCIRSRQGAKGLTQVVPRYHKDRIKGRDLCDHKVSIEVGTRILAECMKKAKGNKNKALGCYSGYKGRSRSIYVRTVLKYQKSINDHIDVYLTMNDGIKNPIVLANLDKRTILR